MGLGTRPATCSATNKRLRRKSWYYRDGKYYYNKRAWAEAAKKGAQEAAAEAEKPAA